MIRAGLLRAFSHPAAAESQHAPESGQGEDAAPILLTYSEAHDRLVGLGLNEEGADAWLHATGYTLNDTYYADRLAIQAAVQHLTALVAAGVAPDLLDRAGFVLVAPSAQGVGQKTTDLLEYLGRLHQMADGAPDPRGFISCTAALDRSPVEEYLDYLETGWDMLEALFLVASGMPHAVLTAHGGPATGGPGLRWYGIVDALAAQAAAVRAWAPVAVAHPEVVASTVLAWMEREPKRGPLLAASGVTLSEFDADPSAFVDDAALHVQAALRVPVSPRGRS